MLPHPTSTSAVFRRLIWGSGMISAWLGFIQSPQTLLTRPGNSAELPPKAAEHGGAGIIFAVPRSRLGLGLKYLSREGPGVWDHVRSPQCHNDVFGAALEQHKAHTPSLNSPTLLFQCSRAQPWLPNSLNRSLITSALPDKCHLQDRH